VADPAAPVAPASLFKLGIVDREYPVAEDLDWELRQVAPQALLRDLHRPEKKFQVSPFDFVYHEHLIDGGRAHFRAARAQYFQSLRVPIGDLLHTNRDMHEEWRALRRTLKLPWQDAPKLESGREKVPW
jgi:hypothetical protein